MVTMHDILDAQYMFETYRDGEKMLFPGCFAWFKSVKREDF
jgi:hypothetical protein